MDNGTHRTNRDGIKTGVERERDDGRRLKKKSSGARAMQCVQERERECIPWIDAASN